VTVEVRFLGSGNAFAAGGRSHACILVTTGAGSILLDCGGSSLPAIVRAIDPGRIDAVAVTHLHGDHFGGIPFLLDEQKWNGRKRAIVLAGPRSLEKRVRQVAEGFGMDLGTLGYEMRFVVLGREETDVGPAKVAAFPVMHSPDAEPHGLRVRVDGKLIAYSGDAKWTDALPALADGADLFICECTWFERSDPVHLGADDLIRHRGELRARRVVLTHLGAESLAKRGRLPFEAADDGTVLRL
jgi:ribonuclease BN (tRNA processing enzyme)